MDSGGWNAWGVQDPGGHLDLAGVIGLRSDVREGLVCEKMCEKAWLEPLAAEVAWAHVRGGSPREQSGSGGGDLWGSQRQ